MRLFYFAVPYLCILALIGTAYPSYQTIALAFVAVPFAILGLLALVYKYMFSFSAKITSAFDWIGQKVVKFLPRKNIPKRYGRPFSTAFHALMNEDQRDLFYLLSAGPSIERYFILRDISDNELKRCIKKLGKDAPQVAIDEMNSRMNGTKSEFDRLEEGVKI